LTIIAYWLTGYWLLYIGHWLSVEGYWSTSHQSSVNSYQLLVIGQLIIGSWLTGYQLYVFGQNSVAPHSSI